MTLGIDVLALAVVGLCMMLVAAITAPMLNLTRMQRDVAVTTAAATAAVMVVAYIIIARILDAMLGVYW